MLLQHVHEASNMEILLVLLNTKVIVIWNYFSLNTKVIVIWKLF